MDGGGYQFLQDEAESPRAAPARARNGAILVVVHQTRSNPGHIGHWLRARGFRLDIRRPFDGDPLPATLAFYDGAIVFGGPMSVNDPCAYIRREIGWIGVALKENKPLLGVCLGAQMLARHLGARVAPRGDHGAEIGYCPIRPTRDGAAMLDWPSHVYQWHGEGFDLPVGATLLAAGDRFENQAYAYGPRAFGLQFHAEVTRQMVHRWTTHSACMMERPGAQRLAAHVDGHARHARAQQAWLDAFLSRWTGTMV
jgi:GMP synthase (glutamine-hydrolysing)